MLVLSNYNPSWGVSSGYLGYPYWGPVNGSVDRGGPSVGSSALRPCNRYRTWSTVTRSLLPPVRSGSHSPPNTGPVYWFPRFRRQKHSDVIHTYH